MAAQSRANAKLSWPRPINPHISRTFRGGVRRRASVGFSTGQGGPSFLEWGLLVWVGFGTVLERSERLFGSCPGRFQRRLRRPSGVGFVFKQNFR